MKGKVAGVPMPGFSAGKGMPSFLGGSVVGVTGKSKNKALATEWVEDLHRAPPQEGLIAKGALPNATVLLDKAAQVKGNEATALAAKNSWFVPMAPKWADVEKANVLQQMLVRHRHRQEDGRGRHQGGRRADHQDPQRLTRTGGPPQRRRHRIRRGREAGDGGGTRR